MSDLVIEFGILKLFVHRKYVDCKICLRVVL